MRTSGAASVGLEPRARHRRHSDVKLVRAACPQKYDVSQKQDQKKTVRDLDPLSRGGVKGIVDSQDWRRVAQTALGQKKASASTGRQGADP